MFWNLILNLVRMFRFDLNYLNEKEASDFTDFIFKEDVSC